MAIIVEVVRIGGEDVEEAVVITASTITTYRNGELAALHGSAASFPNQLGFVIIR